MLFTDLVGSTALLREGPEAFDEIRRAHFEAVRSAISDHRGAEVKSTGDGILATFTSAADAIASAVAIHQAVERLGRRDPRSPAVRVGVSAGEATHEDGDWYGPPVIEAARLCDLAAGGQTLVAAVVSALVGSRGGHHFVPLGERLLKGFDQPVQVVELTWSPEADPDQPPLPPAAIPAARGVFVGRGAEVDRALTLWKRAMIGERQALLVAGEPGVGKTRLTGELATQVHGAGGTVLWGRCDEEVGVAYQPFVEAGLARGLGRGAAVVASSSGGAASADPEGERLRLFEGVADALVEMSADRPVLLVLDDIHWATSPTLALLRHVVRDPRPASVLIVGTYRDTDLGRTHPLAGMLADLRREDNVDRLAVGGLGASGVAAFLEAVAGSPLDDAGEELAAAIHRETEGNPFFVGQVLRHLLEVGAIQQIDGAWVATRTIDEVGIPEGVREVIGRRLSRLSDLANRSLATAAVIGREFDLDLVEQVSPVEERARVLDGLEEAVAAHLVEELSRPGGFAFAHALVRQTLLTELSAARRARLHREIGAALAGRPGADPGMVAHHLCEGISSEVAALAVEWTQLAMQHRWRHLDFEDGVVIGDRALEALGSIESPPPELRAAILAELSLAVQYIGDLNRALELGVEAVSAARASNDPLQFARAVAFRFSWARLGDRHDDGVALIDEALTKVGDADPALRAHLLTSRALYVGVNASGGAVAAGDAREAADQFAALGQMPGYAGALFTLGSVLVATPDVREQLAVLREIEGLEAEVPDEERGHVLFSSARLAAVLGVQTGDRAMTERAIAETEGLATIGGVGRIPQAMASIWRAMLALVDGRFDEVPALAEPLLAMRRADPNFQNSWGALLVRLALEQGTSATLVPALRANADRSPDFVSIQPVLTLVLVDAGEHDEARSRLSSLTVGGCAAVPRDSLFTSSLAHLAEAAAELDDTAAAAELLPLLVPYSGQLQVTAWGVHCLGAMDRFIAMSEALLGRSDEAEAHFAAALALEESVGGAALLTRTRLWWARALMARDGPGDRARAIALADEAARSATALGQVSVAAAASEMVGRPLSRG